MNGDSQRSAGHAEYEITSVCSIEVVSTQIYSLIKSRAGHTHGFELPRTVLYMLPSVHPCP